MASAFLSNSVSSLIQLSQDISQFSLGATGNDIAQTALSNGLVPLAQSAARNVPNVAVSITAASVTTSSRGIQATVATGTATLPLGTLLRTGVQALGNIANAKTIFDLGVATGAAVVCALQ